ncbi:MAG: 30S ribosomal protein S8 [Gammaproteobacteria bacterium]|nr:30S ribosomal protein S8 [Gammaproteobacteria bacterium]
MSMQDPIADMLCRIRNGQSTEKVMVEMPLSKMKLAIAKVLKEEGYILDYKEHEKEGHPSLHIFLKYFRGKPVIEKIERVSKVSLRRYSAKRNLPKVLGGLGVAIISTSRGVMTDRAARVAGVGGEILCYVS